MQDTYRFTAVQEDTYSWDFTYVHFAVLCLWDSITRAFPFAPITHAEIRNIHTGQLVAKACHIPT